MVLATQNPIELEGTYPLPEAQLDRFFFKLLVTPPTPDQLREILHHLSKNWPSLKLEVPSSVTLCEDLSSNNVGGHQVWSELHPFEGKPQGAAHGFNEKCFPETRHPLEQDMPPRKESKKNFADDIFMTDNGLSDFHLQLRENLLKSFWFHQSFTPNEASLDIPKESVAFRAEHPVASAGVTECC